MAISLVTLCMYMYLSASFPPLLSLPPSLSLSLPPFPPLSPPSPSLSPSLSPPLSLLSLSLSLFPVVVVHSLSVNYLNKINDHLAGLPLYRGQDVWALTYIRVLSLPFCALLLNSPSSLGM